MKRRLATTRSPAVALRRLGGLAPLDIDAANAIEDAASRSLFVAADHDIVVEGEPVEGPRLLVDGWAMRVRQLADGRRQLLGFLLPGDLIGLCSHPDPLALATVSTLTAAAWAPAPPAAQWPSLAPAYAASRALEEAYLLDHIVRLGRLTAMERMLSLLLELHERLSLAGLAFDDGFAMPLTQLQLADALGLTPVHLNRMVQQARREGLLTWVEGRLELHGAAAIGRSIGREPVRVSGAPGEG